MTRPARKHTRDAATAPDRALAAQVATALNPAPAPEPLRFNKIGINPAASKAWAKQISSMMQGKSFFTRELLQVPAPKHDDMMDGLRGRSPKYMIFDDLAVRRPEDVIRAEGI